MIPQIRFFTLFPCIFRSDCDLQFDSLLLFPYTEFVQIVKEAKEEGKDDDIGPLPPLTGIGWDTAKYHGTPLELTDRLYCHLNIIVDID